MTYKQKIRAVDHLMGAAAVAGGGAAATVITIWQQSTEKLLVALGFFVLGCLLTRKTYEDVVSEIKS